MGNRPIRPMLLEVYLSSGRSDSRYQLAKRVLSPVITCSLARKDRRSSRSGYVGLFKAGLLSEAVGVGPNEVGWDSIQMDDSCQEQFINL